MSYQALRFPDNPLIHSGLDDQIGTNINGPSLIRVPDWVPNPLGRYYLYFAHHQGQYIRMAYANNIQGPWSIYQGGVLALEDTACKSHIASPDVHINDEKEEMVMYFHGCTSEGQRSFRAISNDGLLFQASQNILGPFYFRVFQHNGNHYAIAKTVDAPGGGVLLRSPDGIEPFEPGPDILPNQRHVAVRKHDNTLDIFLSRGEDCPERILFCTMELSGDWKSWQPSPPVDLLRPEEKYEGGDLPVIPSYFGSIHERVCQLRDPDVFEDNGKLYLLYSGAGESNICGAELVADNAG